MEFEASSAVYAGRFHRAAGSPCQDRTAFARTDRAVCAALADGAGSRAHSEVGAACAQHDAHIGEVERMLREMRF